MSLIKRFKRNQIDQAVASALHEHDRESEDGADLRIRMKRLLDADRALEPDGKSRRGNRATFAFYSGEAPGSGVEVWFSAYEAFALLVALRLLSHGWPQGTVVRLMRQLRPQLEAEHRRVLKQDPAELFDQTVVRRHARPATLFTGVTDPVFLAITRAKGTEPSEGERAVYAFEVCRGQEELMNFILKDVPVGSVTTSLELAGSAHLLAHHLSNTQPKRRGRPA
jgi:hypothetical protein